MPATAETARLLDHIAALEARLAEVEHRLGIETPEGVDNIPWTVIVAAIAAVVREPFAIRRVEIAAAPGVNWWGMEGRLRQFSSRPLR